jgi:hypothetical protein
LRALDEGGLSSIKQVWLILRVTSDDGHVWPTGV